VRIVPGSRALFIGLPGYGKTNLCMALLAGQQSAVIWDAKHRTDEWLSPQWAKRFGYVITSDPEAIKVYPKVIFEVDDLWLQDRQGWAKPERAAFAWTRALQYAYDRGHTIQVHDEALSTLPSVAFHPLARKAATQGRAGGTTLFVNMQAPTWTDTMTMKMAEHVFIFWTNNREDLEAIRSLRGIDPAPIADLKGHDFAYHRAGAAALVVYDGSGIPQMITGVKTGDIVAPTENAAAR